MFNNREINLIKMFLTIMLKWRVIVIAAIVFALIVPIVKYSKDISASSDSATESVIQTGDKVSEDTADDAEDPNVFMLVNWNKQYDRLKDIILQTEDTGFDPDNVTYACVLYYLKTENDNTSVGTTDGDIVGEISLADQAQYRLSVANDLAWLYMEYIRSDEFIDSMLSSSGTKVDKDIYKSFIKTEVNGCNLMIKLPVYDDMDKDALISRIKEMMASQSKKFNSIERHELFVVTEGIGNEKNDDVINERYKKFSELTTVKSNIDTLKAKMTADQIKKAKELYDGGPTDATKAAETETSDAGTTTAVGFQPKYIVLGGIVGAFILVCWYCMLYILSGKLLTVSEITDQAKLVLFETLEVPVKSKKPFGRVDDLIRYYLHNNRRRLTKEQQIKAIVSSISLFAQQNDIKTVCLSSSLYGKEDDVLMKEIVDAVAAEGISVSFVDDIAYDKDALRASADSDGMILIEHIGQSFLSEIEKELVAAKEYNVRVLGAVVLE